MGNTPTTPSASLPLRYGTQGEYPHVLSVVPIRTTNPPFLITVSPGGAQQYNFLSGDRCQTLTSVPGGEITCACFLPSGVHLVIGTVAGEVHYTNPSTLAIERTLRTNGTPHSSFSPLPLRPRLGNSTDASPKVAPGGGLGAPPSPFSSPLTPPTPSTPISSATVVGVSALAFLPPSTLLVGHTDGTVRAFHNDTGALLYTLGREGEGVSSPATSIIPTPSAASPTLVAVGHRGGVVVVHDVGCVGEGGLRFDPPPTAASATATATATAAPAPSASVSMLPPFPTPTPPGLLFLPSLSAILAYTPGTNTMTLYDLSQGRVSLLDFTSELQSVGRGYSTLGCALWDDSRRVLLVGGSDGALYVRMLARIDGTGDVTVMLARVAPPSASAAAPAPCTSMAFHSSADTLLVGDSSGIVRRLKKVCKGGGGGSNSPGTSPSK